MSNENIFRYNYSAKQNEEVKAIRSKYLPQQESKLEELKRLDRQVQAAGMAPSLCTGILGCLSFGLGMCLAMQVIGHSIVLGAFLGLFGTAAMIAAYPVYRYCFRSAKAKHQERILELAEELTN